MEKGSGGSGQEGSGEKNRSPAAKGLVIREGRESQRDKEEIVKKVAGPTELESYRKMGETWMPRNALKGKELTKMFYQVTREPPKTEQRLREEGVSSSRGNKLIHDTQVSKLGRREMGFCEWVR